MTIGLKYLQPTKKCPKNWSFLLPKKKGGGGEGGKRMKRKEQS